MITIDQVRQLLRDYAAHPERDQRETLTAATIDALTDEDLHRWVKYFYNADPCGARVFGPLFGEPST